MSYTELSIEERDDLYRAILETQSAWMDVGA